MGTILLAEKNKKNGGSMWKIYMYLFLFFVVIGPALKVTAPFIDEKWIKRKGAEANGYAFSIRDVALSFRNGQMFLMDVKIFNPKTSTKLIDAPNLTIQIDWQDLIFAREKKISVISD